MIKPYLPILTAIALSIGSAQATIVVNLQADLLKDQNGVAAPMGSFALLVASTADLNFGAILPGSATTVGTALDGADDYIVGKIPANTWADVGALEVAFANSGAGSLSLSSVPGWNAGDPLAIVWIPALTANASVIPLNSRYGLYTRNTATASDGSAAWLTPNDGFATNLAFVTQDGNIYSPGPTASNAPAVGRSSLTVVPEPASASLAVLGIAALCGVRRRRA